MKLRFRANSLRLRVNRREAEALAAGEVLRETIEFPGNTSLAYILKPGSTTEAYAAFADGDIQISAPRTQIESWANGDDIGLYFTIPTNAEPLKVAIEKDLECLDGPVEEKDPNAFPRQLAEKVC